VSRKANTNEDYWRLSSDYSKVDPAIAAKIGFNEAVILRTIYGMCRWKKENDGTEWFQGSRTYWIEKFSWISISTFRRIINKLQQAGLIDVRVDTDGGNHYRPIHENIKKLIKQVATEGYDEPIESVQNEPAVKGRSVQNEPGTRLNLNQGSVQNEPALLTLGSSNLSSDLSSNVATAHAAATEEPVKELVTEVLNSKPEKQKTSGALIFEAYQESYVQRYKIEPLRNAKTNSICSQIAKQLSIDEAVALMHFYLQQNVAWYVQKAHAIEYALKDLQALRTNMLNNQAMSSRQAQLVDKQQSQKNALDNYLANREKYAFK